MKIFQSLKSFFFKPSKLGLGVLLVMGALAGVIAFIIFNKTLEHTSTEEFCTNCHSMTIPQSELKQRVHWSNKFGVTASCADCHLPHEAIPKYIRKIQALKEVYAELTGKYSEEGSFQKHRIEMAKREWARMSANGSQECKNCHRYDRMRFDEMSPKARKAMIPAAAKDQSCIDCHKGIAHHIPKPDPNAGPQLNESLVASSLTADKEYYTQIKTELYSDDAMKQNIGYLEGAVPVKFIKTEGNANLVELEMWRKAKGYGRIWYHDFGMNIKDAVLTKAFMDTKPEYQVLETKEDPMTGLQWQKVKMQAWVGKSYLTSDINTLWANAEDIYKTQCSVCHKQPQVNHFDSNTWIGLFKGMVGFTNMDESDATKVLRYLQMHSSDFDAHH